MEQTKKMMSVVQFPLKVSEKWQEDLLNKRFELCKTIYNNMLHRKIKDYQKMTHDQSYVESKEIINNVYRCADEKEKKRLKKTEEYLYAVDTNRKLMRQYGFSEFDFVAQAIKEAEVYTSNIGTTVAAMTVGRPMWAAFEKKFFANAKTIHFKRYDTWNSIASDGKSSLRLVNKYGKRIECRENNEPVFIAFSGKGGKKLMLPLKIDERDAYRQEMIARKHKVVRLVRTKVRGKYRYSVQLTVDGAPAIRYDKNTGEIKNGIGSGRVGLYIDTTSVTVALPDGSCKSISLVRHNEKAEEKIAKLQQYMDTSRRVNNPDNYNEDGTIKKGILIDGERTRLTWEYSNNYKKARDNLLEIYRIEATNRLLERHLLANEILSYGDEFVINNYPFQAAAMRKKYNDGEEVDENGKVKKKKKAGKAIGHNAPATLVMLLEQKCIARGGSGVVKVNLQGIDYDMPEYKEHYAKLLASEEIVG